MYPSLLKYIKIEADRQSVKDLWYNVDYWRRHEKY